MYALVTDVARYPEFLPWCNQASVISSDHAGMDAQVGISFGGIRQTFRTRNEHVPDREVRMRLVDGPFSNLDGQWRFSPLGDGQERACKVELELKYGFAHVALGKLIAPIFDKIAGTLVEAFVKRAEQVYG